MIQKTFYVETMLIKEYLETEDLKYIQGVRAETPWVIKKIKKVMYE